MIILFLNKMKLSCILLLISSFILVTIAAETKGFQVKGSKLLDANGKEFIIRGINHAHTWFKDQSTTAIDAIAKTGANTIRIVLSNGIQWSKDSKDSVKSLIEQCKKLKMIAILEVHDATGKQTESEF